MDSQNDFQVLAVSISTSDLDRSTRFFCEGLGFKVGATRLNNHMSPDAEGAELTGIPGGRWHTRFLLRPEINIELIQFLDPPAFGERTRKPVNQIGATCLIIKCRDTHATAVRLAALGGTISFDDSIEAFGLVTAIVTDPDGFFGVQLVTATDEELKGGKLGMGEATP
jgi:catechol 2,3-dioxygenase-like lactoylglutathione lyase family enzyme